MLHGNAALGFYGAGKKFGKSVVFSDVDFSLDPGCFLGLAGVNGAGKTTLIKCMLDFCTLDSGRVEIFGVSHVESRARARLAYLPERFNPPYYLNGGDFLNYSMKLHDIEPDKSAMFSVLEDLDLERDALDKPVRAFSKGMTQKLGLAACFLSGKDLFVLDEPMSGLDAKARILVKAKLVRMKDAGKTLLFTSHSLAEMGEICDTMIVLHDGGLKFSGTPDALCRIASERTIEQAFLRAIGD